eukprot:TRINITY_DN5921_c0_g1_i4.p1 TRINITY_DN5921_c0_g1~~TRINITY_DN5921_c0_g1_i4.p1  ORF type:complete len:163 (-),score=10.41 TRINITY_DN5921_c0_g1_i4:382-870(-)
MAPVSFVDIPWLRDEGAALAGAGVPRQPLVVGGSGLIGHNLWVLLVNTPGCEKVRIADVNPPNPLVLKEVDENKVEFVQHRFGTDGHDALVEVVKGCDCVFWLVTPHVQLGTNEEFDSAGRSFRYSDQTGCNSQVWSSIHIVDERGSLHGAWHQMLFNMHHF